MGEAGTGALACSLEPTCKNAKPRFQMNVYLLHGNFHWWWWRWSSLSACAALFLVLIVKFMRNVTNFDCVACWRTDSENSKATLRHLRAPAWSLLMEHLSRTSDTARGANGNLCGFHFACILICILQIFPDSNTLARNEKPVNFLLSSIAAWKVSNRSEKHVRGALGFLFRHVWLLTQY